MTLTQVKTQMNSILRTTPTWWDRRNLQERRRSVDESISRQIDIVTAWNLAGMVQAYWNDTVQFIVKETHQKNSRCINNGVDWRGPMNCFMVGMTVEQATPTVVLTGLDIGVLQRMGTKLKKDPRFRETGFKIRGKYGLLKNCNDDTAPQSPEQTLLEAKVDFFGRSLCFLESPGIRQFGTIGAVIKISEKHFALTAAHVFESNTDKTVPTDTRPEATYAGVLLDDEFFDSFEDEGYDEPSSTPDDQDPTPNLSEHQSSRRVHFEPSSTSRTVVAESEPVIASTAAICHPEDEHTDNTTTLFISRSLDWALIDLTNWSGYEPVNFLVKDGISLSTIDCAKHDPQGEVMIVSQACMYPIARCSGTQALIRMPGCDSFQSVFTLESLPSEQESIARPTFGQSGALVIDSVSGNAYGMLAAQCTSLNMQYMIPLHQIFRDISGHFRDERVMLPIGEPNMAFKIHVDAVGKVLLNPAVGRATPLHVAAAVGDVVAVKAHVRAGADMTARDSQGRVPLHLAAGNGQAEAVQALIAAGAPREVRDSRGQTALILAAGPWLGGGSSEYASDWRHDYLQTVDLLLRNGAKVNAQDEHYSTALRMASKAGHVQVVELLLQHGADVNTQTILDKTSLYMASKAGYTQIVKILLQHGAEVNIHSGSSNETALQAASNAGHVQIVELLLQHGADVNTHNQFDGTALYVASKAGHMQVVKLLLQQGANINTGNSYFGETALHAASNAGREQIVELLLQHGADANTKDSFNNTALRAASRAGHVQVVELLLRPGTDGNAGCEDDRTALYAASKAGHLQVVELLLQHGANHDIKSRLYGTALHAASRAGHTQIVELLLQHGADVNIPSSVHKTALQAASEASQAASEASHAQTVERLGEHGADENAESAERTAPRATLERIHAQLDEHLLHPLERLSIGTSMKQRTFDFPDISVDRASSKGVKSSTELSLRASAQSVNRDPLQ